MRPLSSSPQQEQHMDDVFSATCVGSCGAVVHKCARFGFGCARCARVCRMSLSPDGGFQRVFCEVCAHLQNVSDSVAELDAPRNPFDDSDELCARSGKTAPERISAWGAKASPGAESGSFSVRREKVATFPGAPGAVRGRDLAIWPNLAPRRLF